MNRSEKPEQYAKIAQGTPLFYNMETKWIETLLTTEGVQVLHYAAGESIYSPNCFAKCLGFVVAGQARVVKTQPDGASGAMPMSVLHVGELFGAAALFTQEPCYVADIVAHGSTWAVLICEEALVRMMRQDFRIAQNYMAYLTARIRFLSARLDGFVPPTVEERVLAFVRANATDGVYCPERGFAAMADALRIGRATLYRAFDTLTASGRLMKTGRTLALGNEKTIEPADGKPASRKGNPS